jgi:hypothetical protein
MKTNMEKKTLTSLISIIETNLENFIFPQGDMQTVFEYLMKSGKFDKLTILSSI